jgi:purine nucleosidase/non-specific riboncleoside hydrolase
MGYGNGDIMRFVDPLAAAAAIDPGVVTGSLSAAVAVALAPGLTRGMTVVDPSGRLGPKTVTVVETAAAGRLVEMFRRAMG